MGIMPDFLVARRAKGGIQIGLLELSVDSAQWIAKPLATISTTSFRESELPRGQTRRLSLESVSDDVTWVEEEKGGAN